MYRISHNSLSGNQNKKRMIAVIFLICFIAVSLLSEAFILTRTNHEHDHHDIGGACATCAQLQNAENILKQLGMAAIGASYLLAGLFGSSAMIRSISSCILLFTPVTLKIRMNN